MKKWIGLILLIGVQLFAQQVNQKMMQEWVDFELPHNIGDMNKAKLQLLKTRAFNVIRTVWESPTEFEVLKKEELSIGTMMYFNLQRRALNKARKFLLELKAHKKYTEESSIYLAIALSYYMEDKFYALKEITEHMKLWQKYGAEIPKNLVKMTSYEDSLRIINFLKQVSNQKKLGLLQLIHLALLSQDMLLIGIPNDYYQMGYNWMEFGMNAKDFAFDDQELEAFVGIQWIIPFKNDYFVVGAKNIENEIH